MRGYINKEQAKLLELVLNTPLNSCRFYYFNEVDEESLDYIKFTFERNEFFVSYGSIAEDITLMDGETFMAKQEDQEELIIKEPDKALSKLFGQKLQSYELIDSRGYCHSEIQLVFDKNILTVYAELDNIKYIISKRT